MQTFNNVQKLLHPLFKSKGAVQREVVLRANVPKRHTNEGASYILQATCPGRQHATMHRAWYWDGEASPLQRHATHPNNILVLCREWANHHSRDFMHKLIRNTAAIRHLNIRGQ
jgi:hypothetical protein